MTARNAMPRTQGRMPENKRIRGLRSVCLLCSVRHRTWNIGTTGLELRGSNSGARTAGFALRGFGLSRAQLEAAAGAARAVASLGRSGAAGLGRQRLDRVADVRGA